MIIGTGIDIVNIERFKKVVERRKERFLKRVFTQKEQEYSFTKKDPYPHLAGRFAVKEAIFKALGTGLSNGIKWLDVEIIKEKSGKPVALIAGRTKEIMEEMGVTMVHIGIAHDYNYSIANAILTGEA
ncbi:MAG: holo-ACP synthase [Nitrospirota bacterium]